MSFYPKQLRTVKALEKEKKRLSKHRRQLEQTVFIAKSSSRGAISTVVGMLPISNPAVAQLLEVVIERIIKRAKGGGGKKEAKALPPKEKAKNRLKAAAIEFIGGYLKWKAIELSCKGIRHIIRKRNEAPAPPPGVY